MCLNLYFQGFCQKYCNSFQAYMQHMGSIYPFKDFALPAKLNCSPLHLQVTTAKIIHDATHLSVSQVPQIV